MDLVSLILSCSLYTHNDHLVESTAFAQSGIRAHYVRPQGREVGNDYPSQAQALAAITQLQQQGRGAYIGLLGVPLASAARFETSAKELLEPCKNIAVGTALMSEFEQQCAARNPDHAVTCMLQQYAQLTGQRADVYVETVLFGAIRAEQPSPDVGHFVAENRPIPPRGPKVSAPEQSEAPDAVFWQPNSTHEHKNSLFFDIDIGYSERDSPVKTAKDLDKQDTNNTQNNATQSVHETPHQTANPGTESPQ